MAALVAGLGLAACGSHKAAPRHTTGSTQSSSSAQPAPSFVAGVCRPTACVPTRYVGAMVRAPDGSAPPYGSNRSPASRCSHGPSACDFQIERPRNLSRATGVPAVIAASGTVSGDPQWIAASATDGFVLVTIPAEPWSGEYMLPTRSPRSGAGTQDCGTDGSSQCDDIPFLQAILNAIECSGSPPCQNVNPREVYIEGGSKGAAMAMAAVCDTRTARRFSGMSAVSNTLTSPDPSNNQSALPNCPALSGVGPRCVADCVARPINRDISLQWIYGTDDPNFGGPQTSCTPISSNCLGKGFYNPSKPYWHFSVPQLATTVYGKGALGCPTTPAKTTISGSGAKITTKTYTPCSLASAPSRTATQTIEIAGAQHLPEGSANGGDGISTPEAAWSFWTTYPAH